MTYIKTASKRIFIDVGISYLKMKQKMDQFKQVVSDVDTLFITHEHQDHIMGLKTLLKQKTIQSVYLTQGTYKALKDDVKALLPTHVVMIKADIMFEIDQVKVLPMMISHDANEPVGFIMFSEDKKIVFLTDTGYVDQSYHELLTDADFYLLEANHHPTKLMQSKRPFLLKKRILSERGHLSNDDACRLMNQFIKKKTSIWVVAHMSEDCNDILDVEESIVNIFDDPTKVTTYYASQESLPVIKL